MAKKTMEEKINKFLELCDIDSMCNFLRDIIPLIELYDVDENNDWVKDAIGEDGFIEVRLIRTVYLMSKIAENHSGMMASIRARHPRLWEEMDAIKMASYEKNPDS